MKITVHQPWLLALLALALTGSAAQGQGEQPRRYVEFPVDADYEAALKKRFATNKELEPFKELIKKILEDPSKMPKGANDLKGLKLDDEKFKKALKEWLNSDQKTRNALEQLAKQQDGKKLPGDAKKFQEELKNLLKQPAGKQPDGGKGGQALPGPLPIPPQKQGAEDLGNLAERAMKQAETTGLGDWLRDSPAWRRAFSDMRSSINAEDAARWQEWLRRPDKNGWKFGEGTLERIRKLPRPNVENWKMPGLGGVSMPNLGGRNMPDFTGPSLPSVSAWATWLLFIILLLLAGWWLMRWHETRKKSAAAEAKGNVGPWPVQPDAVATRGELVRAFNYLALLTLGLEVQSWNHHAVAERWRAAAPTCGVMAQALESLYEQARYTDGDDTLTPAERDQARQSLAQLAGAF